MLTEARQLINQPTPWLVYISTVLVSVLFDYFSTLRKETEKFGFTVRTREFVTYEFWYLVFLSAYFGIIFALTGTVLGRPVTLIEVLFYSPSFASLYHTVTGGRYASSNPSIAYVMLTKLADLRLQIGMASDFRENEVRQTHVNMLVNLNLDGAVLDEIVATLKQGKNRSTEDELQMYARIAKAEASAHEIVEALIKRKKRFRYFKKEFDRIFGKALKP